MLLRAAVALCLFALPASVPPGSGRAGSPPRTRAVRPGASGAVTNVAPASPLRVVRPFRAPASRYGPGHRGVDLAIGADLAVLSAGTGVVRFAGSVAGRGVVVVAHPDGIITEYEPVGPAVRVGAAVRAGQLIGHVRGTHRGCPHTCLHWGARRADDYFDPLTLLKPLGPVVLLPWPRDG